MGDVRKLTDSLAAFKHYRLNLGMKWPHLDVTAGHYLNGPRQNGPPNDAIPKSPEINLRDLSFEEAEAKALESIAVSLARLAHLRKNIGSHHMRGYALHAGLAPKYSQQAPSYSRHIPKFGSEASSSATRLSKQVDLKAFHAAEQQTLGVFASSQDQLAQLYTEYGMYEKSIELYTDAIKHWSEASDDVDMVIATANRLARVYIELGQFPEAIALLDSNTDRLSKLPNESSPASDISLDNTFAVRAEFHN